MTGEKVARYFWFNLQVECGFALCNYVAKYFRVRVEWEKQ